MANFVDYCRLSSASNPKGLFFKKKPAAFQITTDIKRKNLDQRIGRPDPSLPLYFLKYSLDLFW